MKKNNMKKNKEAKRGFATSIRSILIRALIFYSFDMTSAPAVTLSRIVEANGLAVLTVTLRPISAMRQASLKPSAATKDLPVLHPLP